MSKAWIAIVLIVSLASVGRAQVANATTAEVAANRDSGMRAVLEKKLPEVRFDKNGFGDVIDFLRDVSGANISVDWKVLEKEGIKKNKPVSARLRNISLGKCLQVILDDVGGGKVKLKYAVDRDVITISTAAVLDKVETRVFDVRDLAGPERDRNAKGELVMSREWSEESVRGIVKLVKDTVSPATWGKNGRTVLARDGQMTVAATTEDLGTVEQLLAQLREQRGVQIMVEAKFYTVPDGFLKEVKGGSFLSDAEARDFSKKASGNIKVKVLGMPKLIARNGEEASFMAGGETPSVIDYKAVTKGNETKYEPVIKNEPFGTMMSVTGVVSSDRKYVTLTMHPKIAELKGDEKEAWKGPDGKGAPEGAKELKTSRPVMEVQEKQVTISVPLDKTAVVELEGKGEAKTLVFVTAQAALPRELPAKGKPGQDEEPRL
jgi:hypothetical protein